MSKKHSHVVLITEVLAIPANSRSGISLGLVDSRLDVEKQIRGDLKETYNMGKFADPEYKQIEPETITQRREEFIAFTKECYQVELKVLVLFALALDVFISPEILADL
jgi:hypothetical protein